MTVADYILSRIAELGVGHAFLVTGGAIANVVHSFDETKNIKYICTTHEQGAAMAAEGYARVNKKLGVALATSGPGATNLITGIGCAYFDSIPTLYITGQVNVYESTWENGPRQVGFQETDIVSIAKPITKFAVKVDDAKDIRYFFDKAVYLAQSGRPGPVLLDIPMNVQRAEIDPDTLRQFTPSENTVDDKYLKDQIVEMISLINISQRPVIILGAGVKLGHAENEIIKFVERLGIPVVTTWGGIDVMVHDHPLYVECFGVSANRAGNFTVQNADLLISLGARLDTRETGGKPETFARHAKKVVLDIDAAELHKGRGIIIDVPIHADIKDFLRVFFENERAINSPDIGAWKEKIAEWKYKYPICRKSYLVQDEKVNPYVFMDVLSDLCSEGEVVVADTGSNLTWTMQGFKVKKSQQLFSALGNSPMGYSLPAAIGASVAADNKQVICIIGDGGLKMNINELETVVRYKLPVKIFVINNHGYGCIKQFQDIWLDSCYKATSIEGGLGDPDFVKIAQAYGMMAMHIKNQRELSEIIGKVMLYSGPVLCEVDVLPEEKINPKLEFGRPIEDPSPLLSRDDFMKDMIIPSLTQEKNEHTC